MTVKKLKKVSTLSEFREIQRYKCLACGVQFSSKRRLRQLEQVIINKYFYRKQTLRQLAHKYMRSISWIRKQIFKYEPELNSYITRDVLVIIDATFFGKCRDMFSVLIFKDVVLDGKERAY